MSDGSATPNDLRLAFRDPLGGTHAPGHISPRSILADPASAGLEFSGLGALELVAGSAKALTRSSYTGFTVPVLEAAKSKWLFPLRKSHPDGSEDRRHQL